jgi:hypothetical protein
MRLLATAVCLSLCATLGAQVWSPTHFAKVRATGSNVFPFGSGIPFRYAQIHDDVTALPVKSLTVRRTPSTSVLAAGTITVDAFMSTAATSSATPNLTFDSNHGANKVQVISNKTFNQPASSPDFLPHKFDISFPFDVVFPFTGSGSLCWEVHVLARVTVSVTHDNFSGANTNPAMAVVSLTTFRPGCIATGRTTRMGASASSAMSWPTNTGTLRVTGSNALASGVIITAVGTNNANWGPIPLPFEIPGSATAPSGACNLYNDVILLQVTVASTTGASTTNVPVPATIDLHGLVARSQNWCLDAAANPLGVVTSNAVLHQWVAPFGTQPACRIYLSGSLGATASGSQVGGGNVTQFN